MFIASKVRHGYHNIKRYQFIISVLIRHGFYDFVDHSNLLQFAHFRKRFMPGLKHPQPERLKLTRWQRIRCVLEELGPTFVKLGQFASNRPDLVPKALCLELESLLDAVPPFDGSMAKKIIERELEKPVEKLFKDFDMRPLSSASIAQVHKAILHDGSKVAVKIQRPNIKEMIETDLEIMIHLATFIERFNENLSSLHPVDIIEDFRDAIRSELDFNNEAFSIDRFTIFFKDYPLAHMPRIYKELSSRHVLTMEFIDGVKLAHVVDFPEKYDPLIITDVIADILLKQIFEMGYFHADPHSGNIIVQEGNIVCLIDFGLVGTLPPKHKEYLSEIIMGLVTHDSDKITEAVINISDNKDIENRTKLEYQVFKVAEHYAYIPLKDMNIGQFLNDLLKLIIDNKLKIPSDIYMLLKAIISLEGTVKKIKPDFDMIEHITPFVKKLLYENANPIKLLKDLIGCGVKYTNLIKELPNGIREVMDQLKNKNLKIQFEHKGLEPMLHKHDQISNRISYAIVTASMMISSALLLHARIPPTIHETSLLGIAAFIFALIMGSFLLISILRHGKM